MFHVYDRVLQELSKVLSPFLGEEFPVSGKFRAKNTSHPHHKIRLTAVGEGSLLHLRSTGYFRSCRADGMNQEGMGKGFRRNSLGGGSLSAVLQLLSVVASLCLMIGPTPVRCC